MPASRSGFQSGLKYYGTKQDAPKQDIPIIHRYVEYSSTSSGEMVATSSTIKTKHCEKVVEDTTDQMEVDPNTSEPAIMNHPTDNQNHKCSDDAPIDQAYIEHMQEEGEPSEEVLKRIRPKGVCAVDFVSVIANSNKQDESLWQWEPYCDLFMEEMIRHEGWGFWSSQKCVDCKSADSEYECVSCGDRQMRCSGCLLTRHSVLYLHRIRVR